MHTLQDVQRMNALIISACQIIRGDWRVSWDDLNESQGHCEEGWILTLWDGNCRMCEIHISDVDDPDSHMNTFCTIENSRIPLCLDDYNKKRTLNECLAILRNAITIRASLLLGMVEHRSTSQEIEARA